MSAAKFCQLAAVCDSIGTGDLLLYRRRGPIGWLIGAAGRSHYSHVGMAVRVHMPDRSPMLLSMEMLARGGTIVPLDHAVTIYPGRIDLYSACDTRTGWDAKAAATKMAELVTRRYGWWHLLLVALWHLPIVRLFMPPLTDDEAANGGRAPICSEAVAIACRAGGVDPVPNLSDRVTEPADLARSLFFHYQFTLVP